MQCESTIKGKPIFINGLSILNDALVTVKFIDGERFEGLVSVKESKLVIPEETQVFPTGYFVLGVEHLIGVRSFGFCFWIIIHCFWLA